MANPPIFQSGFDYSNWQTFNPTKPLPGQQVDNDFANAARSINQAIGAIGDVRRSDGKLKNGIVTADSLSPTLSLGFSFEGAWQADVSYSAGDGVVFDQVFYAARVSHTSSVSNQPPASEYWTLLFSLEDIVIAGALSMPVDTFASDGVTTDFSLSFTPISGRNLIVTVGGQVQAVTEYGVNGNVISFDVAPPVGPEGESYAIEVRGFATTAALTTVADGSVTRQKLDAGVNLSLDKADAAQPGSAVLDTLAATNPGVTGLELLEADDGAAARSILDPLRGFHADGVTDDSANFAALAPAYYGKELDLGGRSYAVDAYPFPIAYTANTPIYKNGKMVVGGVPQPMPSVGSIISDFTYLPPSNTPHRVSNIAGDRNELLGLQLAAVASSRVTIKMSDRRNPNDYVVNCNFSAANVHVDIPGFFHAGGVGNRLCEFGGQRTFGGGNLMSRVDGFGGILDAPGRWNLPQAVFPTLPDADPWAGESQTTDTFYTFMGANTGTIVRKGSGNAAIACRGEIAAGGDTFQVITPVMIEDASSCLVHARNGGHLRGTSDAILASNKPETASGLSVRNLMGATDLCTITAATESALLASNGGEINAPGSGQREARFLLGTYTSKCWDGPANARGGGIIGAVNAYQAGGYGILSGRGGANVDPYCFAMTYTTAAPSGVKPTVNNNRKIVLDAQNALIRGTVTGSGLDHAELMPNKVPGVIPVGTVLVKDGREVRPSVEGDTLPIQGIVSANPTVLGGESVEWGQKYLKDEWGVDLKVDVPMVRWAEIVEEFDEVLVRKGHMSRLSEVEESEIPDDAMVFKRGKNKEEWVAWEPIIKPKTDRKVREAYDGRVEDVDGEIPDDAIYFTLSDWVLNPDYDPDRPYVYRADRPEEWTKVGIIGQFMTRVTEPFKVGDYIGHGGKVSVVKTDIRVDAVERQFDQEIGDGRAWCYANIGA